MIHGGAGGMSDVDEEKKNAYFSSMGAVLAHGEKMLVDGADALDVVESCTMMMEDDPMYNAGKGSVLNENGKVEMDAAIMNGKDLVAGSVAGIKNVRNPIRLARLIMEKTPHVMMVGSSAQQFADIMKVQMEPDSYFILEKRIKQLEEAKKEGRSFLDVDTSRDKKRLGTVGVVARDVQGNLAAATSTGGMVNKKFGRVGDSPIVGAGVYADNQTCAVSCTGVGEHFLRTVLAKMVSDFIYFKNFSASEAAQAAISYLVSKIDGAGGIIVIDKNGQPASAYSTEGMIRAWVTVGEKVQMRIWKDN